MEEANPVEHTEDKVLYATQSICAQCSLLNNKGLALKPAQVVEWNDKVLLTLKCDLHGEVETLYCSDVEFFKKTMSYTFDIKGQDVADITDIEDINQRLKLKSTSNNLPFTIEFAVYEHGNFVDDEEIQRRIKRYLTLYPPGRKFVLKVLAKLAPDIAILNNKLKIISAALSEKIIVVEASFERLCLLCELQDSIFLNHNIYPALKYYLKQGDEQKCIDEMLRLFEYLKSYQGIQLVVTLCVSRPFADMSAIIAFIRQQFGFIRVFVISMERSPQQLLNCVQKLEAQHPLRDKLRHDEPLDHRDSIDIYELLEKIEADTQGSIGIDDFYPMSLSAAMEPFVNMLGYGFYFSRPSPFCGFFFFFSNLRLSMQIKEILTTYLDCNRFGTCLVNTDKAFMSYPVPRLFDIDMIFREMKPILPRLQDGKIGLYNGQRLKKVLHKAAFANKGPLPDLAEYLIDPRKADQTKLFIQNLQFVVIHNNMDVAALDMVRRCNCTMLSQSAHDEPFAYCTGCI